MNELVQKNLKWIILVVIFLTLINVIAVKDIDRLSKKERRQLQKQYDSLRLLYIQKDIALQREVNERRKIFLLDSFNTLKLKQQRKQDSILILKQKKVIGKYTNLPSSINLTKLDSAYEAEH